MKWSGIALGALSLAAVLTYVVYEAEEPAPGPLHPSHAHVEALNECAACHDGSWKEACGACHTEVALQLDEARGLHGLIEEGAERCARCHVDHHGAEVALVAPEAFAALGIATRDAFDHERHAGLATGLSGRHLELECADCHPRADATWLMWGQRRFLGLAPQCTECHEDAHAGRFGTRCEDCHGQSGPFDAASGFDHSRFALSGAHADVECAACHADGVPEHEARGAVRVCSACHDDPHDDGSFVFTGSEDCVRCHGTVAFGAVEFGVAEHAAAALALHGQHAVTECAACHTGEVGSTDLEACEDCHADPHASHAAPRAHTAVWSTRYPCGDCHDEAAFRPAVVDGGDHGRFGAELAVPHGDAPCAQCHQTPRTPAAAHECAACHASPHAPHFVAGTPCGQCHLRDDALFGAASERLSAERHVDLRLEAPHDLSCSSCHAEVSATAEFARRFPGRDADECAACHGDPHEGQFQGGAFAMAACVDCHERERFTPSAFSPSMHARTAMPLDGAHAAVACVACHEGEGEGETGALRFDGLATECEGCHPDPHRGVFDRAGRPATFAGRTGCARCHTTEGFRSSVAASFDHELWTGQALAGAHARAACGRCHDRGADGSLHRAPAACAACHEDPHRGQFARDGETECARCHEERDAFSTPDFDHDHDTRFPLDSDHARLPCASCHRRVVLPSGRSVVVYRPLGTACRDCHAPGKGADREIPR